MVDRYNELRKTQNIRQLKLPNKDKIYCDLMNIEHSWTGRMDVWSIGNTFIMEAEQQLINALELFEQGYFDCAYYSLRSAVDVSTTIVFLADMPDKEREAYFVAWKATKDFPMQGQMINLLSAKGYFFSDMKEKMPDFFINAKELCAELNKYVHKQGLKHFYVSRNHPVNGNKSQDKFIKNFEYYLKQSIGVVAAMRLALDPFPILLMDKEILYRYSDSMTDPYSEEFIDEYIGLNTVDAFKTTEIYQENYHSIIGQELKTEAVFNVVKHQFIDSRKMDEILQQLYLMSKDNIISVLMVYACDKVVKTYCQGGFFMYFTEKNTNRKAMSWSSLDFENFAVAENQLNLPYDEAYLSVFQFDNEKYYVEHNEQLDSEDAEKIVSLVAGALFKINETNAESSQ